MLAPPVRALDGPPTLPSGVASELASYAIVVSRLAPEKGVDVAIDACRAAGITLVIAGDGPEREALEARAAAAGRGVAGATVRFAGRVDDAELAELRARASIALVPSRSAETFGLAAAEAMAAGLPVLASRVGALQELVEEDALVAPGDPVALATAIERLAGDRAAGERGRQRARAVCAPDVVAGRARRAVRRQRISSRRAARPKRADHRADRAGRFLPGRAAAGEAATAWSGSSATATGQRGLGSAEHLRDQVELLERRRCSIRSLRAAIARAGASEIYHLAAPSFVPASWERPGETIAAIAGSTATLLTTVRELESPARVLVAASGEIFGDAAREPAERGQPRAGRALPTRSPSSPPISSSGACASTTACTPAPPSPTTTSPSAVPSASSRGASHAPPPRSRSGARSELELGALDAVRDWSFAGDIVRGAWLMLQQAQPGDYVLSSGVPHTVAEFARGRLRLRRARRRALPARRPGAVRGPREHAQRRRLPQGSRAARLARPSCSFEQLVERMVRADLRELEAAPR